MELSEDVRARIHDHVWGGFLGEDEVVEIVLEAEREEREYHPEEGDEDDPLDEEAIVRAIRAEFARKREAEQTWPAETDCDRLDRVFADFSAHGIVALQNAGYTQSDGIADVSQCYHAAGGERSSFRGYCFYHGQDLESAIHGGGLYLAFGDVHGTDEVGVQIGALIQRLLTEAGFPVEWDGSIKMRLNIPVLDWKRRSPWPGHPDRPIPGELS